MKKQNWTRYVAMGVALLMAIVMILGLILPYVGLEGGCGMKHCILARFRADAGDWRAYLPENREIFSAAGDIPGVRGAEVFPNCVDRENRYHVLIRLAMDPAALAAYDVSPMHHRWKDRFGPLLEKKAIFDFEE